MFHHTPEKYETKALNYERNGKTAKAMKYREKATKLRQSSGTTPGYTQTTTLGQGQTPGVRPFGNPLSQRTPQMYETKAMKWEQRGNYAKAQKNREKVWRLQNPQYATTTQAPMFYQKNTFAGYNVPHSAGIGSTTTTYAAATVEHVVHPTILQQTSRPERIVEVQPVIHREIDAPQVRIVEQHTYERVPNSQPSTYTNAAIVQETVRPHIIEDVQQVVHREVPAPFVERVEQHVTEHLVNPTITTKEVQNAPNMMGVAAGGMPMGMNQGMVNQQPGMMTNQQPGMMNQQPGQQQQGGIMGKVQNALKH